jgi:nucleoside-diphosphate-sugar epimerase
VASATVLVTGATGSIGGAAAALLLDDARVDRLLLLVRAQRETAGWERARRSLLRFATTAEVERARPRIAVLSGDLRDDEVLADRRLDEVTHVLHAAANTSFRSVREVHRTNVRGALALARRMERAPRLERYLHVSTAYCCGATTAAVVQEDDAPRPGAAHVVEYTRSKAECELLLAATATALPLVIARPSIVVGHTELGCAPSASLFWYYRALARLGRAPFPPERARDIVPVDYVAEALQLLLFSKTLTHRVYHISSGEGARVRWGEIAATFARHDASCPGGPPRCVDADSLADPPELRRVFGPGDAERLAGALALCARFGAIGIEHFDNRRLLAEGMRPPPRFTDYLERCITHPPGRGVYEDLCDDA